MIQSTPHTGLNYMLHQVVFQASNGTYTKQLEQDIDTVLSLSSLHAKHDSEALLTLLIGKALKKKLLLEEDYSNLYTSNIAIPQIQLFNILIEKFPFVKYSQQIINQAILQIIAQHTEVTLIDIGIGQGTQILNVIEHCKELSTLKKLTIIGIEPFADALYTAQHRITAMQHDLPFTLEFIPINNFAENFDFSTLNLNTSSVIVNASLALHHIQSDEQRTQTLANIKELHPIAIFLTEPNVDHFEENLYKRFVNCFNHYGSLFQVIDLLDVTSNEKQALKLFFGREIEDVIGKENNARFEKHEPATTWLSRLRNSNFTVINSLVAPAISPYGVKIKKHDEGFLGFTYKNETVLSLICAQ
ncbi:MAG: GRAS family protein [Candidatus Kapaibacterium sp.]